MINILIRTSERPKAFKRCIESIAAQTYRNVRLIVGNDNNDSYCADYNPVRYKREIRTNHLIDNVLHFPYNSYLNDLLKQVQEGWVMILDDDDMFFNNRSLEFISRELGSNNRVVLWNVSVNGRIVPAQRKQIIKKDISMIGFCFHSKYIPLIHIAPYRQADFRLVTLLYNICTPVWINETLTQTQTDGGMGKRIDF